MARAYVPAQDLTDGQLKLRVARYDGFVLADDHGSRYTGKERITFGANWNSPTGRGDRLGVTGLASTNGDLLNARLAYSGLVRSDGTRLEGAVGRTTYSLGDVYSELGAKGTADSYELNLTHPWKRTRNASMELGLGLAHRELRDVRSFNGTFLLHTADATIDLNGASAVTLGSSTVNGNLVLLADSVQQSGALSVSGTTYVIASTGSALLNHTGNTLGGAVSMEALNGDVAVSGSTGIVYDVLSATGNLTLTADGDITPLVAGVTGIWVAGSTTVTAGSHDVYLGTHALSQLHGPSGSITIVSAHDARLAGGEGLLTLGAVNVTGDLTLQYDPSSGGYNTLNQTAALHVAGDLRVEAVAMNASPYVVDRSIPLNVELTDTGNTIGGTASFDAHDVQITANLGGTLTLGSSTFTGLVAQGGHITVAGTLTPELTQRGTVKLQAEGNIVFAPGASIDARNAGQPLDVVLWANHAGYGGYVRLDGSVSSGSAVYANGGKVWIGGGTGSTTWSGLTVGDGRAAADTSLPINDPMYGRAVYLGSASRLSAGQLQVKAADGVATDLSGEVQVSGATQIDAGGADIDLLSGGNHFVGAVSLTTTANVQLHNDSALVLGSSSIGGGLDVENSGAITQAGALHIGGTFYGRPANSSITLTDSANTIGVVAWKNITNGSFTVTGPLVLEQRGGMSGNLVATALGSGGSIAQNGALTVGGTTTFAAQGAVTLDDAGNHFSGVVSGTGGAVSLRDSAALTLGNVSSTNLLAVAGAASDLVQAGNLSASTGGITLVAGSQPVAGTPGGNYIHQSGTLTVGAGQRWLIYSDDPSTTVLGSLPQADFARPLSAWSVSSFPWALPPSGVTAYTSVNEPGNGLIFVSPLALTLNMPAATAMAGAAPQLPAWSFSGCPATSCGVSVGWGSAVTAGTAAGSYAYTQPTCWRSAMPTAPPRPATR